MSRSREEALGETEGLNDAAQPAVWDGARHFEDRAFWDSPAAPTAESRT